jgi:NAD/NADP transhydrogenase alpha subunit
LWWLGVGVFGAFALFLGLIDLFNVTEGIEAAEGGDVSISAGLYVVLLGAVAAFAGALIRERSVRPVTADGPAPT